MPAIFEDFFKKSGFMDGLAPSLSRESEKGKLESFLPDFAQEIGVPLEGIRPFFQSKDWEHLVRFLMAPS